MTAKQKIDMALAYSSMTHAELAARLGWSPQLLHKRINTGKFTLEEWEKIARAVGADGEMVFTFRDGRKV